MITKLIKRGAMLGFLAITSAAAIAEDIDVYVGGEGQTGASANVLIVLDNSANWSNAADTIPGTSTKGQGELESLLAVLQSLDDSINVGLLMSTESGSTQSGYVRQHIRPMTATNRARFEETLNDILDIGITNNKPDEQVPNNADGDSALDEAFRYFASHPTDATKKKSRYFPSLTKSLQDYKENTDYYASNILNSGSYGDKPHPSSKNTALSDFAYDTSSTEKYNGPPEASAGCAKNFIIYIGNQYRGAMAAGATRLQTSAGLIGVTLPAAMTVQRTSTGGAAGVWADEWTQFMYRYGVPSVVDDPASPGNKIMNKIITYTLDVHDPAKSGADPINQTDTLINMAQAGGGKYFEATNRAKLEEALKFIFSEIQSVNSAFASATLPISVNTQGTFENQVYIGVFRPDGNAGPRWFGNLKGYRFGRYCDANEDTIVDMPVQTTPPATLSSTKTATTTDERIGDAATDLTCTSSVRNTDGVLLSSSPTNTTPKTLPLSLYLADKIGYPAIDQKLLTGFFDQNATSYWTHTSSFWDFSPAASGSISDLPDGPLVERGAAAQMLREKFAKTAVSPHTDGRKVLTCLVANGCSVGGTTDLTASSNVFYYDGITGTLAGKLPQKISPTVKINSITRTSGNLVRVVTAADHKLQAGSAVTIANASPTEYNGNFTVVSVTPASGASTQFDIAVLEAPPTSDSGVVTATGVVYTNVNVASITVGSPVAAGSAVSATASVTLGNQVLTPGTSGWPGLTLADTPAITGANQAFLNKTATLLTATDPGAFTYAVNVTPAAYPPSTFATSPTATSWNSGNTAVGGAGSATLNVVEAYYDVPTRRMVLKLNGQATDAAWPVLRKVDVTGAPAPYARTGIPIVAKGTACPSIGTPSNRYICFDLPLTSLYISPDGGTTKLAGFPTTPAYGISIVRSFGTLNATATLTSPHVGIDAATSVKITGTMGYDGTWTVPAIAAGATTIPLTLGGGQPVTAFSPALPTIPQPATATAKDAAVYPTTENLILWSRGQDLQGENKPNNNSTTDVRASVHGDVLHSRPAIVNYGGLMGIYGFYGSNDGFLRGMKAGVDDVAVPDRGQEKWAFIPEEFIDYDKLNRLYGSEPSIRYPSLSCDIVPQPKARDYFWDGPIAVIQSANQVYYTTDPAVTTPVGSTRPSCLTATPATCYTRPAATWLFAGMRRGGKAMYALDITLPETPKLLWRINNSTSGFEKLGQTWSEPKFVLLKHLVEGTCTPSSTVNCTAETLAIVFGGGYDAATEDVPPGQARAEAISGYGVYVVNAETGAQIAFLEPPSGVTKRSIPSDVTPIDTNGDGFMDRIYAADTGANILRFDADPTKKLLEDPSAYWKAYHIAKLGTPGGADDRVFVQQPAVIPYVYNGVQGYNILIGSGNREKPLANRKPYTTPSSNPPSFSQTSVGNPGDARTLVCTDSSYYSDAYFGTQIYDKFYSVLDTSVTPTNATPVIEADLQLVNATANSLVPFSFSLVNKKGWYINLSYNPYQPNAYNWWEEKLVNSPRVDQGIVYFATNTPQGADVSKGVCSNLGTARDYAIDPFTGLPAFNRVTIDDVNGTATYTALDYASTVAGGGLGASATFATVKIGTDFYRAAIGAGGRGETSKSSQESERTDFDISSQRTKIYWLYGAD